MTTKIGHIVCYIILDQPSLGKSHHFDVWIMCLFHDLVLHCFLFHSVGQGAIIKIIIPTHDKLMEIEHLK